MITNVLQMLHTTAAYQTAAMQLMAGEANFAARQLDLKETVPAPAIVAATNGWDVEPPPEGVGGTVTSSNYTFSFHEGKLRSIDKYHWLQKISPPVGGLLELAGRPSLLDTNSAYQLATQRLAALSVDVAELERKFPPTVFQVPARRKDSTGQNLPGVSNNVAVPLFLIGWSDGKDLERIRLLRSRRTNAPPMASRTFPPGPGSVIRMQILGTTREVVELEIRDPSLLERPALQLTNAAELLGPTPPPRHFVEDFVGGKDAYETIANPDKVEAWLLTSSFASGTFQEKKDRTGPLKLDAASTKAFSDALLDFDTYLWNIAKRCIMDEGARLKFTRGSDVVEVRLCYECDMLVVIHNGQTKDGDFDNGHNVLVKALQLAFPDDAVVEGLKLKAATPR